MNHAEHHYVELGYRFEKAARMSRFWATALADEMSKLVEKEVEQDQIEVLRLFNRGREEARS